MELKEIIARDLNVPLSLIDEAIEKAHSHVKVFYIPKHNGAQRKIFQPTSKLKTIQYWIINKICNELPVDDSAFAYVEGLSILDNAERHQQNRYFLKIDLKDFFPSIKTNDFMAIVRTWHSKGEFEWPLNRRAERVIRLCCFDKGGRLPIGYPSSPAISNAVMFDFDKCIKKEVAKNKYGNMLYTRYADDLVFSTNKKGACYDLIDEVESIIKNTKSPNININKEKISFSSSSGGSAIVTGLRIAYDSHITLHRKQKDHIRLLLSLLKKNKLDHSEYESLLGHINYARYIDPSFYSKMQQKYFSEIDLLRVISSY